MLRVELKDRTDADVAEGPPRSPGSDAGSISGGTPPGRRRGNPPLERVTVNLNFRTAAALERASQTTGDSKTDTINRALQLYAMLVEIADRGGAVYIREEPGAELERQRFV